MTREELFGECTITYGAHLEGNDANTEIIRRALLDAFFAGGKVAIAQLGRMPGLTP